MQDKTNYQQIIRQNKDVIRKFRQQRLNTETFILLAIDNSTIRAFGKCSVIHQPLSLYRSWAYHFLINQREELDAIFLRRNFSQLHRYARKSLEDYWKMAERYQKDQTGRKLPYHLANKIIDLFFKFMPWWNELNKSTADFIFENAHVPLDKHSLAHLKKHASVYPVIPDNASMILVNNPNLYQTYQDAIKQLTGKYPAITFDLIAQANLPRFKLILKKDYIS